MHLFSGPQYDVYWCVFKCLLSHTIIYFGIFGSETDPISLLILLFFFFLFLLLLLERRSSKKPKAPSFQIGSG